MCCHHAVFGDVEEVVQKVLVPRWCMGGGKERRRAVRRYMCRKVIWAQVLKVGVRPSAREEISTHIR